MNRAIGERERTTATLTLFGARAVYAFNWYNVGAVLPLVGVSFGVGVAALGLVLGAFLIGVGVFQIPAGLAAIRWNPRAVSLAGLSAMGAACLASGFAPDVLWLAVTRFAAGVSAAFFFAPGLGLIASYYPEGRRGPAIGFYNGAFSVGAAFSLYPGVLLGERFGWPWTLAGGGVALLVAALVGARFLPRWTGAAGTTLAETFRTSGRAVLRSRSLWGLAVGLTGFWAAIYIVSQFFVKYAHDVYGPASLGAAGGLAALLVVISVVGGPAGGWFAERGRDRRWILASVGATVGLLVLAIPFAPFPLLWPTFGAIGLVDGAAFAVLYLIPSYLAETRGVGVALGVAFVNSIQVLLGSGLAIAFGLLVEGHGYTLAWVYAGLVTLALLPLLAFVEPNRAPRRAGRGTLGEPRRSPGPADAPAGESR